MLKKTTLTILIFLGLTNTSYGFTIPEHDNYVTDIANVLSIEEEQILENQIYTLRQQTANEIAVLLIPSTEGEDIAMLATDIGNKRGVGDKQFNNGIIILIATEDRKRFTAVGYGLEGTLPDAIVKRMGEENFPPNFKQLKYYEGINATINDIQGYMLNDPTIKEYYKENQDTTYDALNNEIKDKYHGIMLIIGTVLGAIFFTTKRKFRKHAIRFGGLGGILGTTFGLLLGDLLVLIMLGYIYLSIGIIISYFKLGGLILGIGTGGSRGGGGSSFGGFGGGSFGGGGSGGNR